MRNYVSEPSFHWRLWVLLINIVYCCVNQLVRCNYDVREAINKLSFSRDFATLGRKWTDDQVVSGFVFVLFFNLKETVFCMFIYKSFFCVIFLNTRFRFISLIYK